jgi:NADH-quinone oxidoreductase subunit D
MWTGARLTTSLTRVGGLMADIPDGFEEGLRDFVPHLPDTLREVDTMFTRNAIWIGRTQGVGGSPADEATNYSLSGPMLRASGVDYDVRKDRPYLGYETYDFDVPVGEHGDIYDRYPRPAGGDVPVQPDPRAWRSTRLAASAVRRSTWTTRG